MMREQARSDDAASDPIYNDVATLEETWRRARTTESATRAERALLGLLAD